MSITSTGWNPATFRLPPPDYSEAFGGGHTSETNPVTQGWRIRPVKGATNGLLILGIPGVIGCASILPMEDGKMDIAIYAEEPKTVEKSTDRSCLDPAYFQSESGSAWALQAIQRIKARMAM